MGKALRGRRRPQAVVPRGPAVVNGARLTQGQRDRLVEAEGLAVGSWRDRQRAAAMVREVEAELTAARAVVEIERGIEERLERARRRGEVFGVETVAVGEWRRDDMGGLARRDGQPILDVQRVRRASRVDGLVSLFKAGSLTDEEKQVGDAYRALFERARPPMSVSAYGSTQAGFKDVGHMLVSVAEAGQALGDVSEIARRIGDARAVAVLEAVAGRGATIRSLGDGGDLKIANRERLKRALKSAKETMAALKKDRETKLLAAKAR